MFSERKIPSFSLQTERNILTKQGQIYALFYTVSFLHDFCFMFHFNDEVRLLSRFNCREIVKIAFEHELLTEKFLEYCSVTCFILRAVSFGTVIVVE